MDTIRVPPFSQYTNFFRLRPEEAGQLYRMTGLADGELPSDYYLRHDGQYYSLKPVEICEATKPSGMLLRRIIMHRFRDVLQEQGFKFKGLHNYLAYYSEKELSQPHSDVFSAFTGFEFRVVEYEGESSTEYYLVVDPHIVFQSNMPVSALVANGVDPNSLHDFSVRLEPDEKTEDQDATGNDDRKPHRIDAYLVETIRLQESGQIRIKCHLTDLRSGTPLDVDGEKVFLEPRPEIIKWVLEQLRRPFDVIRFQREKSLLSSSTASKDRFAKTQEIVRDYMLEKAKVFPLQAGEIKTHLDPNPIPVRGVGFPKLGQLAEPPLLFDRADSSAVHAQAYWGLRTFGPYSKDAPIIRLALFGTQEGVRTLKDLVRQMNMGTRIMPGGMPKFFNTSLEIRDEELLTGNSVEDYIEHARHLGARNEKGQNIDVVLLHLGERTSNFEVDTPYYNAKAVLLEYGFPSQMVTAQALVNPEWIHANLAAAIFAKAGKYPWVLETDISEFDMIIGVGLSTAISKTKRAGSRPRYIGYANVFDQQGRWMFFESTSQLYEYHRHQEQLAEIIGGAVERFKQYKKGQYPTSIALHYHKRFSQEEMSLVENVLRGKLSNFRIAFVAVDKSHPMRLYDLHTPDGSFPRGCYAQLSDEEFLLSTTGHTPLAKKRLGTPEILKISIAQSPEPFVTVENIATQVLALTRLNYKTLTPIVGEPVTLLFANLVAGFAAVFSESQWQRAGAQISAKLNTVLWFL